MTRSNINTRTAQASSERRTITKVESTLSELKDQKVSKTSVMETKLPELEPSRIQTKYAQNYDMRSKLLQNRRQHATKQSSLQKHEARKEEQAKLAAIVN